GLRRRQRGGEKERQRDTERQRTREPDLQIKVFLIMFYHCTAGLGCTSSNILQPSFPRISTVGNPLALIYEHSPPTAALEPVISSRSLINGAPSPGFSVRVDGIAE
ncbi:Protein EXORDIUM-like 2, partial [Clarias magur]